MEQNLEKERAKTKMTDSEALLTLQEELEEQRALRKKAEDKLAIFKAAAAYI